MRRQIVEISEGILSPETIELSFPATMTSLARPEDKLAVDAVWCELISAGFPSLTGNKQEIFLNQPNLG